jgi:hypothetical protein
MRLASRRTRRLSQQRGEIFWSLPKTIRLAPRFSIGTMYISSMCECSRKIYLKSKLTSLSGPLAWLCNYRYGTTGRCDPAEVLSQPETFTVRNFRAKYCYSRERTERCKVRFSLPIIGVVIATNCIKALCILLTLWTDFQGFVTVGDAISSFLYKPDATTGTFVLDRKMMKDWQHGRLPAEDWRPQKHRWFEALSVSRWLISIVL